MGWVTNRMSGHASKEIPTSSNDAIAFTPTSDIVASESSSLSSLLFLQLTCKSKRRDQLVKKMGCIFFSLIVMVGAGFKMINDGRKQPKGLNNTA